MKKVWIVLAILALVTGLSIAEPPEVQEAPAAEEVTTPLESVPSTEIVPLATSNPPSGTCTFGQPSSFQCQAWSQYYCDGYPAHCVCTQWTWGPGGLECSGSGQCDCT